MKKILLSILLLTESTLIYSQSMDLNHKKIHIVDSTMGLGITPTSRLHVFGNGTASNLFKLYNNRGTYNDSSIIVKANGSLILGDSSFLLQSIDSPISESRVTIIGGVPLRLLNNFNRGYTSLKWSARTDKDTIADYAQIMGGVMRNTYGANSGELYFQTKMNGGMGTRMYIDSAGYVGINTVEPKYRLDIGEGGTDAIRNEVLRINSADNNELSNSIILLARGDITRTTIATSSTNNLFIKGSKENDLCIKTESNNILFSANDDDELDIKIDTNGNLNIYEEIIWRDGVGDYVKGTTLSDNEAFEFPTGYSWKGEIDVDSLGFTLFTAQLRCDATGTPYLEGVSWKRWSSKTYIKMGSEDGYFNVIDGVSRMIIANSLGYTIKATLRFRTKQ